MRCGGCFVLEGRWFGEGLDSGGELFCFEKAVEEGVALGSRAEVVDEGGERCVRGRRRASSGEAAEEGEGWVCGRHFGG